MRFTTAHFFRNSDPALRLLYRDFLKCVRRIGPVTVNVTKTRISFQSRVRFAGVAALRKHALIAGFWLKRRLDTPRFARVEFIPPDNYVYQVRLTTASDLNAQLKSWLREVYHVGEQRHVPVSREGSHQRRR